jgi:hypothetical protein
VKEGIDQLATLCLTEVRIKDQAPYHQIPTPRDTLQRLLEAAHVCLPKVLPKGTSVTTIQAVFNKFNQIAKSFHDKIRLVRILRCAWKDLIEPRLIPVCAVIKNAGDAGKLCRYCVCGAVASIPATQVRSRSKLL